MKMGCFKQAGRLLRKLDGFLDYGAFFTCVGAVGGDGGGVLRRVRQYKMRGTHFVLRGDETMKNAHFAFCIALKVEIIFLNL
jgi:hypothetical protein